MPPMVPPSPPQGIMAPPSQQGMPAMVPPMVPPSPPQGIMIPPSQQGMPAMVPPIPPIPPQGTQGNYMAPQGAVPSPHGHYTPSSPAGGGQQHNQQQLFGSPPFGSPFAPFSPGRGGGEHHSLQQPGGQEPLHQQQLLPPGQLLPGQLQQGPSFYEEQYLPPHQAGGVHLHQGMLYGNPSISGHPTGGPHHPMLAQNYNRMDPRMGPAPNNHSMGFSGHE